MVIYELEVQKLYAKSKNKHSPFRYMFLTSFLIFFTPLFNTYFLHTTYCWNFFFSLQVQCEYEASDLKHAADLRTLYAATNPPPVVAMGTIRVQMRIAKGDKM